MAARAWRLVRLDPQIIGWAAAAALLAAAAGLAVGSHSREALDVAVLGVCSYCVATRPYAALLFLLVIRTAEVQNGAMLDLLTLGAGGLTLLVLAPRLPAKWLTVPFLILVLLAAPSLPLLPSADEGFRPPMLQVPLISYPYLKTPSGELLAWVRLASLLVIFCLAAWTITTPRRLRGVVIATLVSAVVPIEIAVRQLVTGQLAVRQGFRAVQGPFTHPNYFAFYLVVVLVVAIVTFIESRSLWERVGTGLVGALAMPCLVLTYTRSAWIAFAIALVLLGLLRYRTVLVVGVVALGLAAFLVPSTARRVQQRFGDLSSQSQAHSTSSWSWRTGQWGRMVHFGLDRPLTGTGFESYPRMTLTEFGREDPKYPTAPKGAQHGTALGFFAHNDYVKMLVEMGFPGVILWTLVLIGLPATGLRARRVPGVGPAATAVVAIGTAFLIISVSDNLQDYTVAELYAYGLAGSVVGVMLARRSGAAARSAPADVAGADRS